MAYKWFYLVLYILFIKKIAKVISEKEKIPRNYLELDEKPTVEDLDLYIDKLETLTSFLVQLANGTDGNQQMGNYYMSVVLRRTLLDYEDKLEGKRARKIRNILKSSEIITANFVHLLSSSAKIRARLQLLIYRDTLPTFFNSIGKFNRKILPKFLYNNMTMNKYVYDMDDLSLPKEKYAMLTEGFQNPQYSITGFDSDKCLSRVMDNIVPTNPLAPRQPCVTNELCKDRLFRAPSVAYTLSHRLVSALLYMNAVRCYFNSEDYDLANMHTICAGMYRETVYIARRGFFARDLFMEHIGLCTMMGYEEFHRRKWFLKAASWIDEDGCLAEFHNFALNRTIVYLRTVKSKKRAKAIRLKLESSRIEKCHYHLMAVAMMMLASGARHAAHYF